MDRHPQDLVICPSEGTAPLPRCTRCGMQTAASALMRKHQETKLCKERWRQQVQHETVVATQLSLETRFFAYGEELERVQVFKYLGKLVSYDDNDTQAMRGNLAKAHRCWAWVSQVLRSENASLKVCGVFYKATIQAVLLFGSETWNSAPSGMACLEGFHLRAAWHMSSSHAQKRPDGT
jgi:hypothetical protein